MKKLLIALITLSTLNFASADEALRFIGNERGSIMQCEFLFTSDYERDNENVGYSFDAAIQNRLSSYELVNFSTYIIDYGKKDYARVGLLQGGVDFSNFEMKFELQEGEMVIVGYIYKRNGQEIDCDLSNAEVDFVSI